MNILLVTPLYSQHHDAGHFWLRAFNQLGHTVTVWDYRLDRLPPPLSSSPNLVLVMKGEGISWRDFYQPTQWGDAFYCYWPDDFKRTPGIDKYLRLYDKVFTPVSPTPDGMVWLPSGWDPAIHKDYRENKVISTIYVGTNNSERKEAYLKEILPSLILGNGWLLPPERTGPALYLHDFVKMVNLAKIAINIHQGDVGLNRKLFELIPATFTITDRVPGVEEVLGKELADKVSFNSAKEAKGLITYYLEHDKERNDLWEAEKQAIKPYTYIEQAKKILRYLK